MKSAPNSFISLNTIDQHHLHAIQMHIHAYTRSVHDSELYSGIQGQREHLWTLVDPDMYRCHVDIFPHYSLYFSYLIFPQKTLSSPISSMITWQTFPIITASCMTSPPYCQGMTCFPLWRHLRVFPTPTSDTFGILQTPTASEFQRHFGVLPTPTPIQQPPMLLHAPPTLTPWPTSLLMATPKPLPPPKVTWRPLWSLHFPIRSPLWCSLETLWAAVEVERLPQHPILRVKLLR